MATAVHAAGQFPAPMDQTNPTPKAWVVGQTTGAGGVMDLNNLNANNVPPLQMQAIGFPAGLPPAGTGRGFGTILTTGRSASAVDLPVRQQLGQRRRLRQQPCGDERRDPRR